MISGAKKHLERLLNLRQNSEKNIAKRLYVLGQEVELEAERLITEGSISGAGHIPSLPGQPPNADTRHLDGNINTYLRNKPEGPGVEVVSEAAYSAALEYGTADGKLQARPFMRPALQKLRKDMPKKLADEMNTVIRASK